MQGTAEAVAHAAHLISGRVQQFLTGADFQGDAIYTLL